MEKEKWECEECDLNFRRGIGDEYTQDQFEKGEIPESDVGEFYYRIPYDEEDWKEAELLASNDGFEWFSIPSVADAKADDVCEKCIEKIKKQFVGLQELEKK